MYFILEDTDVKCCFINKYNIYHIQLLFCISAVFSNVKNKRQECFYNLKKN